MARTARLMACSHHVFARLAGEDLTLCPKLVRAVPSVYRSARVHPVYRSARVPSFLRSALVPSSVRPTSGRGDSSTREDPHWKDPNRTRGGPLANTYDFPLGTCTGFAPAQRLSQTQSVLPGANLCIKKRRGQSCAGFRGCTTAQCLASKEGGHGQTLVFGEIVTDCHAADSGTPNRWKVHSKPVRSKY